MLNVSDRVGRAVFAYIEFSRRDEATRAIAKGVRPTQIKTRTAAEIVLV